MHFFDILKNIGALVLAILFATFGIFIASNHFMNKGFEDHFYKDMETIRVVVDNIVATYMKNALREVKMLARTRRIEEAFTTRDPLILDTLAKYSKEYFRVTFATITDSRGKVLARGHKTDIDDISNFPLLKNAIHGKASIDIVRLKNKGLSLAAAVPVYVEDDLAGVLVIGITFQSNTLVDEIKAATGFEMTIFDGCDRISTTIIRDGKRVVGTTLNNPAIANCVLTQGNIYSDDADILGKAYKTMYWPLKNTEGTILGMWFIGTEMESFEQTITSIAISCLITTLLIALTLSGFGGLIFHTTVKPLKQKAYVDKLTGIANRAGFEKNFEMLLENGLESGTLFLIDLDNFKNINDYLGHPVGDECLKRTAQLLKEVFRATDLIARLGGDEFIVFAPTMNVKSVIEEKAQKFLAAITHTYPVKGHEGITVTASVGIAIYPIDASTTQALYSKADSALYAVKKAGRNGYRFL